MDLLLEWVHGGLEGRPSLPQARALFEAAHKYDLAELRHWCEQLMAEHVSMSTYPELMDLAYRHHASVLEKVGVPLDQQQYTGQPLN